MVLPSSGSRLPAFLARVPLWFVALAAVGVIAANLTWSIAAVRTPYPIDMWEAAATSLAAQIAAGVPIYSQLPDPTSAEPGVYPPLQPFVLAGIFRFTGPNLWVFRAMNVAAGVLFIFLFLKSVGPFRSAWVVLFGVALLFAVDRQMAGLWDLPRLDAILNLLALVYIICGFRAVQKDSIGWLVAALVVLLAGFLWKQTMVAAAPIPFLASLFVKPRASRRMTTLLFFAPAILPFAAAGAMAVFSPNMFKLVLGTLGGYSWEPFTLARLCFNLGNSIPLIWVTVLWMVASPGVPFLNENKSIWTFAAVVVTVPACLFFSAKLGAGPNRLAFALFAVYAVVLACIPAMHAFLQDPKQSLIRKYALGISLSVGLIWTSANVLHTPRRVQINRPFGDSGRAELINLVRALPGKVVCPQDPTIPLFAKDYAGISLVNEFDSHVWQWPLPKVLRELNEADYVVTYGQLNSWQAWPFAEGFAELERLGYERLASPSLEGSDYSIWHRPKKSAPAAD